MLRITIPAREFFDDESQEFITTREQTLTMEHSLISISKWESKWKKSYFSSEKNNEEILDYFRCMTITPSNPDELIYKALTKENVEEITAYITDPMTATTIRDFEKGRRGREIITSEIIYYWMIAQQIPIEFEKWHINRLLTLIRVCSIKNNPNQKKMSRSAIAKQNHAINKARRAKYGTRG